MQKLSVVIICKNGAGVIDETLESFTGLTDDIIVYDNGSTDDTRERVRQSDAKLVEGDWQGFGKTKNKANELAKYDWILSLDADEAIDDELKENLFQLDLADTTNVYEFKFRNFLGKTWLRFGEWGDDKHIRLFNRREVKWNNSDVHESLLLPADVKVVAIAGHVLHRTAASISEYEKKMEYYAGLNAEKYLKEGKTSSALQSFFAAGFSFVKNYIFKLGFLDGATGFRCAKINSRYTFLKYEKLRRLTQQSVNTPEQSGKTS